VGRIRKFLHLSPAERRLFIKAWLWLGMIRLMLWLLPFQMHLRFLARLSQEPRGGCQADLAMAERVSRAVEVMGRFVPQATCLTQALAAQMLLKRGGFSPDLRIGVAKTGERQLQGHAWVENHGRIMIGDNEVETFVPFPAVKQ
jgi:hypothetical protein